MTIRLASAPIRSVCSRALGRPSTIRSSSDSSRVRLRDVAGALQWDAVRRRRAARRGRPDARRRRPHPDGVLGDMMKESVRTAVSWVRANTGRYGFDAAVFRETDPHVHAQSAAETKDGPRRGGAAGRAGVVVHGASGPG